MPTRIGIPSFVTSFDGTQLAAYDIGLKTGPIIFLFNGLGGNLDVWDSLISFFKNRYRFISFDYRGIFESGTPQNRDFSFDAHARDALTVMEHFGVESATFVGWSMGVQVALETWARAPAKANGIVLISGVVSKIIDKIAPRFKKFVLPGMDLIARYYPVLRVCATPFTRSRLTIKAAKALRLLSSNIDENAILHLANEYRKLDFANYRHIVYGMAQYDATPILPTIRVPTLILGGVLDRVTPPDDAKAMADAIPGAELLILEDASHYSLVEYPDLINMRIDKFFHERLSR